MTPPNAEAGRLLADEIERRMAIRDPEGVHQFAYWLVEQVPAILAALRGSSGWLPIAEAPKGVKLICGYKNRLGNWRSVMGRYYLPETLDSIDGDDWADEGWYEESETHNEELLPMDCEPTHYMPLPLPPTASGEPKEKERKA